MRSRDRDLGGAAGSAAVVGMMVVVVLFGLSGAMLMTTLSSKDERAADRSRHQATALANAGVAHALTQMSAGGFESVGSYEQPWSFGGGDYFASIESDEEAGLYTVSSYAEIDGIRTGVEAVFRSTSNTVFDTAVFAGNVDGDPNYTLELGGTGSQADLIDGDIYSGGDVTIAGTASVTGTLRAYGDIYGASGETGITQPVPDIAAMNYEDTADVQVLDEFLSSYYYAYDSAGGYAFQVPESSPAHIFRVNPSDRYSEYISTPKVDFFLEDPYESVTSGAGTSPPYAISLSGVGGEPGPNGNEAVYFIDGNLWIHNKRAYSLAFESSAASGVQVTFVVKGNIYFSDNILYENVDQDGVAFIAMKDSAVSDSGNIYFGDTAFGTLEEMHAFMYAENNFYDQNLDASGSSNVRVFGNMTAGNQVQIERDYGGQHTQLVVDFDSRITQGDLEMPNLPTSGGGEGGGYTLVSWRKIALP